MKTRSSAHSQTLWLRFFLHLSFKTNYLRSLQAWTRDVPDFLVWGSNSKILSLLPRFESAIFRERNILALMSLTSVWMNILWSDATEKSVSYLEKNLDSWWTFLGLKAFFFFFCIWCDYLSSNDWTENNQKFISHRTQNKCQMVETGLVQIWTSNLVVKDSISNSQSHCHPLYI